MASQRRFARPTEPTVVDWASPQQEEAFKYGPYPVCASGGFGAAKSYAFCMKALWLSDQFPGNRGVIFRKVWDELKKTTMQTFFKICPPEAYSRGRRNDQDKILELNNGSVIYWMHMDDPDIEGVIRGLEINWFFGDQAEEIPEEVFDLLRGRLGRWDKAEVPAALIAAEEAQGREWQWRNPISKKPVPPAYAMIAVNPDTELHWVYRRFHPDSPDHWDKKLTTFEHLKNPDLPKSSYHDLGYKMITMSSRDNKFLPKQNLDILLQNDVSFVRRFVDGLWGIPEAQIHHIDPLSIIPGTLEFIEHLRRTSTLHRVLDHGDAAPTACAWMAVDKDGNTFYFREYYMPNRLVSEHRAEITALSEGERYVFNLADPSIFHKMQQKHGGRWCVADEYADARNLPASTAIYWQPADNNELGTRNRVSEYLRVDKDRIHPYTKERGAPRLFFVARSEEWPMGCREIIRQTKSQRRLKVSTEAGRAIYSDERDESVTDHAYDLVRYGMASRPPIAVIPKPTYSRHSFAATRQRMIDGNRRRPPRRDAQLVTYA